MGSSAAYWPWRYEAGPLHIMFVYGEGGNKNKHGAAGQTSRRGKPKADSDADESPAIWFHAQLPRGNFPQGVGRVDLGHW